MQTRKKYQLPVVAKLDHIQINTQELEDAFVKVADSFVDVRTANPFLCDNHQVLSESVYSNFDQINLTTINRKDVLPFTADIRERIRRREERLYNKPTLLYSGSYFEKLVANFRAPAIRVRITRLAAGSNIPHHIDYDPSYATRIVIPIRTNKGVINEFKVKSEIQSYHLCSGAAYFLNTGFSHAVYNRSCSDRIALMFSLDGQEDLCSI